MKLSARERDALAKGPNPIAAPPKPGERCPRCHSRKGTRPERCELCNPPPRRVYRHPIWWRGRTDWQGKTHVETMPARDDCCCWWCERERRAGNVEKR